MKVKLLIPFFSTLLLSSVLQSSESERKVDQTELKPFIQSPYSRIWNIATIRNGTRIKSFVMGYFELTRSRPNICLNTMLNYCKINPKFNVNTKVNYFHDEHVREDNAWYVWLKKLELSGWRPRTSWVHTGHSRLARKPSDEALFKKLLGDVYTRVDKKDKEAYTAACNKLLAAQLAVLKSKPSFLSGDK